MEMNDLEHVHHGFLFKSMKLFKIIMIRILNDLSSNLYLGIQCSWKWILHIDSEEFLISNFKSNDSIFWMWIFGRCKLSFLIYLLTFFEFTWSEVFFYVSFNLIQQVSNGFWEIFCKMTDVWKMENDKLMPEKCKSFNFCKLNRCTHLELIYQIHTNFTNEMQIHFEWFIPIVSMMKPNGNFLNVYPKMLI